MGGSNIIKHNYKAELSLPICEPSNSQSHQHATTPPPHGSHGASKQHHEATPKLPLTLPKAFFDL
jgi:hypothetical protein